MKRKVGVLTFSDGRRYIHEELLETNWRYQDRLVKALEATGEIEVVAGEEIIWSPKVARREGQRLAAAGVDVTIFNYAIWAFPNLSGVASRFAPGPFLLFSNLHPSEPGMVAMLAAAGMMDQLGATYKRLWGDINDPAVHKQVLSYLRAANAIASLKGQTYGLFGGRPLGMLTAVANQDEWLARFGIDVEHIEQWDIMRLSEQVDTQKVEKAFLWLEQNVGHIAYDGRMLTPEKLKLQIRSYYALQAIIAEKELDFLGIKAHGDLTDHFITMDIAEAFLNDPYDFDGPKEPFVAATEADMDGALTMQLFRQLTGEPTLFADVRHYDAEDDVWYFSNSGTHATFFAGRSKDPAVNLRKVSFLPEVSYYPAGGASVQHFAAPGTVTLARLARKNGKYWLAIVPAEFVEFPEERARAKAATVTPEWPIAFTRLRVTPAEFLSTYPCNHIHGVYGDWVDDLQNIADILGIEAVVYG